MGIDSYLEQVREEGDEDSEGVFTMAVAKAAWKLAEYQLADPGSFPLHIVACAIANGASQLRVYEEKGRQGNSLVGHNLTYFFDGENFTSFDLEKLSQPILGSGVPKRLSELGIVLNALGHMGFPDFRSYTKAGAIGIIIQAGEVIVAEIPNERPPGQYLKVYVPLSKFSPGSWVEACRYAPLEIELNGTSIRKTIDPGVMKGQVRGHYHVEGADVMMVRPSTLSRDPFFRFHTDDSSKRSMVLALLPPESAEEFGFHFIADGRIEEQDREWLHFSGLCGVVSASGLQRDISQSGFVQNQSYQQFLDDIREAVVEFITSFCAGTVEMPRSESAIFRAELLSYFTGKTMPKEVADYLASQVGTAALPLGQLEEVRTLGAHLRATEDWETFGRARETLTRKASAARKMGEAKEALASLELEQALCVAAESTDDDLDKLIDVQRFVVDGSVSASWPAYCLRNSTPVETLAFPSLIMSMAELSETQFASASGRHPAEWRTLLEFALCFRAKSEQWPHMDRDINSALLGLVLKCEAGQAKSAVDEFRSRKVEIQSQSPYRLWLGFFLDEYRGHLSFLTYVSMHTELSLMNSFKSSAAVVHRNDLARVLKEARSSPLFQHFDRILGKPEFLPLVIIHFVALSKRSSRTALQFLGRILLLVWLGKPDDELRLPSEIPVNFLFGGPPKT